MSGRIQQEIAARRERLTAAIAAAADGDMVSLAELARVHGVTKSRISNKIGELGPSFPDAERRGRESIYPATAAYTALLTDLERAAKDQTAKRSRWNDLLGGKASASESEGGATGLEPEPLSAREIQMLTRTAREQMELQKDMGKLAPVGAMQEVIGDVFSVLARGVLGFRAKYDPAGRLSADEASRMDKAARELLVQLRKAVEDYLDVDSDGGRDVPAGPVGGRAEVDARRVPRRSEGNRKVAA